MPSSRDLPNPGVKPTSLISNLLWQAGSLPLAPSGKPLWRIIDGKYILWALAYSDFFFFPNGLYDMASNGLAKTTMFGSLFLLAFEGPAPMLFRVECFFVDIWSLSACFLTIDYKGLFIVASKILGFPDGSAGKESTCNAGDTGDVG